MIGDFMFYFKEEINDLTLDDNYQGDINYIMADKKINDGVENEEVSEAAEEAPAEEAAEAAEEAPAEEVSEAAEEAPAEEAAEAVEEAPAEEAAEAVEEAPAEEVAEAAEETPAEEAAEAAEEAPAEEAAEAAEEAPTEEAAEVAEEAPAEEVSEAAEETQLTPEQIAYFEKQDKLFQATYIDMRKDLPEFRSGDTVSVGYRVIEGESSRIQNFDGVVIKVSSGHGMDKTFTVRKVSSGIGVERIFPFHSPNIDFIKVIKQGKVRRAKLYYLRDRVGKATRIKEKIS
jgi:large subunit ribosomal protein L19